MGPSYGQFCFVCFRGGTGHSLYLGLGYLSVIFNFFYFGTNHPKNPSPNLKFEAPLDFVRKYCRNSKCH